MFFQPMLVTWLQEQMLCSCVHTQQGHLAEMVPSNCNLPTRKALTFHQPSTILRKGLRGAAQLLAPSAASMAAKMGASLVSLSGKPAGIRPPSPTFVCTNLSLMVTSNFEVGVWERGCTGGGAMASGQVVMVVVAVMETAQVLKREIRAVAGWWCWLLVQWLL